MGLADATISYKPQHIDVDIDGSVQLWLDSELGPRWRSGEFNVNVIKALGIDQLLPKRVKKALWRGTASGFHRCVPRSGRRPLLAR